MLPDYFEQAAQITKAHGYDILVEQVGELKAENERLKVLLEKEFKEGWTMHPEDVEIEWKKYKTENKL